jgi:hypothetical protein
MSDSRSAPLSLDLISKTMNELAQEIGEMEPDDPKRAFFLKELSALPQLRRSLKSAGDHFIGERMDELAREMTTLKPGNSRRAQIVQEIMRLSDSLKQG